MSKSVLYASNSNTQTLDVGSVINFGSVVRRYGCNCNISGGNVVIEGCGYYNIDTNFTILTPAAGDITITLYKDGTAIPGATITKSVAADSTYAFSIPAIVRETCCCETIITAVISGVAGTVSNASITVEKL